MNSFIRLYVFFLIIFVVQGFVWEHGKHIISMTHPDVQQNAVQDLIKRTIGTEAARSFVALIDQEKPFRNFYINKTDDNIITIVGYDGVTVAKGFHHYLKYYLHYDVTWTNKQNELHLPAILPNVTISSEALSPIIYYQNVCTWSYSFSWWEWSTWQRHIDWMAMMGINLSIAPVQEHIWHEVYSRMGLTAREISEHFGGPAFQAWQRMGNIRGWGGPLSANYRRMQFALQKKIIRAQRDLGISVALPAFAGHVPVALVRLYPNATFTPMERWNQFPNQYCCPLFLEPNEPLFTTIAKQFLEATIAAYGKSHIYFCDPFNEMQPRRAEPDYMNSTAHHIYESMRSVDAEATWLLQGWMFVKNIFWTDDLIAAFLKAVPPLHLLVLDLQSEQFPQYERTHMYHGHSFIWCMLHNFGGTLGMHGSVDIINTGFRKALSMENSTAIGMGITPEGIHQNYALYALALERAWVKDDFDLHNWFSHYATARYGIIDERLQSSWHLLQKSVYSYYGIKKMRGKYTITRRPSLDLNTWTWYNITAVHNSWLLLLASNDSIPQSNYENYEHDLVDVTRQFLQAMSDRLYVNLMAAYKKKQLDRFSYVGNKLMDLFEDLEHILATNTQFLLGPWLESAKSLAQNASESRIFEMNARNQITAWGPQGQILDYATKQWSGIVRDYYQPRWELFLNMLHKSLESNTKFNSSAFKEIVSNTIELPFSTQTTLYPTNGTGNTFYISQRIFNHWTTALKNQAFSHYAGLNVKYMKN